MITKKCSTYERSKSVLSCKKRSRRAQKGVAETGRIRMKKMYYYSVACNRFFPDESDVRNDPQYNRFEMCTDHILNEYRRREAKRNAVNTEDAAKEKKAKELELQRMHTIDPESILNGASTGKSNEFEKDSIWESKPEPSADTPEPEETDPVLAANLAANWKKLEAIRDRRLAKEAKERELEEQRAKAAKPAFLDSDFDDDF